MSQKRTKHLRNVGFEKLVEYFSLDSGPLSARDRKEYFIYKQKCVMVYKQECSLIGASDARLFKDDARGCSYDRNVSAPADLVRISRSNIGLL